MVPTNDFLPFCPTDTGTNLLSEADYTVATDRDSGNKPGVASSKLNNKAIRQANAVTSQLAQLIANKTGTDVLDDAISAKLLAQMTNVLSIYPPNLTQYLSGAGTFALTYIFQIATGSATSGATYTNNGHTFTVTGTVASGVSLKATGNGAPAVSGTLTKASGTGDATITFYAVRAAQYIRIRMIGGGGGGGGSSNTASPDGGAGGAANDSTFGGLLTAGGGQGAAGGNLQNGGDGGNAIINSPAVGIAVSGSKGDAGQSATPSLVFLNGGMGASSAFGGGGAGSWTGSGDGVAAQANSGSGGGGATCASAAPTTNTGGGGGAGAFIDVIIIAPSSTYVYSVGSLGAGGLAGSGGGAPGGDGAAGQIEVTEYYQ